MMGSFGLKDHITDMQISSYGSGASGVDHSRRGASVNKHCSNSGGRAFADPALHDSYVFSFDGPFVDVGNTGFDDLMTVQGLD